MSIEISFKETFHSVGQGLFYSATIECDGQKILIVYDCGSERISSLRDEIERFKRRNFQKKEIDLLIISHFHEDHVNGLRELLDEFDVRNIVIPYIHPFIRLGWALKSRTANLWYYEFLANPVRFLTELLTKDGERREYKIFVIKENGKEGVPEGVEFFSDGEVGILDRLRNVSRESLESMDYDVEEHTVVKTSEGYIGLVVNTNSIGMKRIVPYYLAFYNYHVDIKELEEFLNRFREALLKESGMNGKSNDFAKIIKEIANDADLRKRVKKAYEESLKSLGNGLGKRINNTSLITYIGPHEDLRITSRAWLNFQCLIFEEICRGFCMDYGLRCFDTYCHGGASFLTGDISLNHDLESILKHFKEKNIDKVNLFLIPHHGSKHNWNPEVFKTFPNACMFPVSYGIKNKYRHPSRTVVSSFGCFPCLPCFSAHRRLICVNEVLSFERRVKLTSF